MKRELLKQSDFKMIIVRDLGTISKNGAAPKRRAIFICNECSEEFEADVASVKHKQQTRCVKCRNGKMEYGKNIRELAGRLNSHTRYNCRKRNQELPFWKNTFELEEWLTKQNNFDELYSNWANSDYNKNLTPSIDRIDNSKSYTIDNIELVTWQENDKRGSEYLKSKMNKHGYVSVYYESGEYIDSYTSISEASKIHNCPNLPKVITGERNKSCGLVAIKIDEMPSIYEKIRMWSRTRGLYSNGNPQTQALKLITEIGELFEGILKNDDFEIIDAIADIAIVLTNLADIIGLKIEECLPVGYDEINSRKGKMINGSFVKQETIDEQNSK